MSHPDLVEPAGPAYSKIIGRPIDNTALKEYTTCPRKYLYSMVLHRRKSGPPTPALAYGSAWHVAMETHYKAPQMSESALFDRVQVAVAHAWQDHQDSEDYRTFDRVMLEYKKYVRAYGLPWNEDAKTVGWPDAPLVEMSTEVAVPGARHPYTVKIDRIIERQGQFLVEDHKTASQFGATFFRQFELDNQMIGYASIAQLLTGKPISGVRINAHVCRKNDDVFERRTISIGQDRIAHWMFNYEAWLIRMEGELGMLAHPDPAVSAFAFPHNFNACAGKYGMCQYASICSLAPHLRQGALEDDFDFAPWDPLAVTEETPDA